jgi:hypothetical protein
MFVNSLSDETINDICVNVHVLGSGNVRVHVLGSGGWGRRRTPSIPESIIEYVVCTIQARKTIFFAVLATNAILFNGVIIITTQLVESADRRVGNGRHG